MHRTDDNPKVPWVMYPNDKNSRGFVVVGEWHNNLPYAPDCYIQAVGDPQLVIVTEELYTRVYNEKHNIT